MQSEGMWQIALFWGVGLMSDCYIFMQKAIKMLTLIHNNNNTNDNMMTGIAELSLLAVLKK